MRILVLAVYNTMLIQSFYKILASLMEKLSFILEHSKSTFVMEGEGPTKANKNKP